MISMTTNKAAPRRLFPLFPLFALMLLIGAFFFAGAAATYAADAASSAETLSVDEVWLTGDTLHITVADIDSGARQTLELNLKDYAKSGDEYVTVQATDGSGHTSNSVQFKNPYYTPAAEVEDNGEVIATSAKTEESEPSVPKGNPFTPDGTGSVVDNATDGDGKEFFTVETPDGNVFYLIVDRERSTDNVYLLNAVTENDLASLAKPGDGKVSAVTTPEQPEITPAPEQPGSTPPVEKTSGNKGAIAVLVVVLIAGGGAGYYFKIVRPRQDGYVSYDGEPEDYDEPDEEESIGYDSGDDDAEEVGGE
jgi:hypothetical protein